MENEIQQNVPQGQTLPQTPPLVPPFTNWLKILLFTVLGLIIVAGSVFVGIQIGKNQEFWNINVADKQTTTATTLMNLPSAKPTEKVVESVKSQSLGVITLNVSNEVVNSPENYVTDFLKPSFSGDLTRGKPTFASSYWESNYPSNPTSGKGAWTSAGSNGTWYYVDLGAPKTFRYIISTLFVDSAFTSSPITTYIVSNNKISWMEIYREINPYNLERRGQYRHIALGNEATARYVGFIATSWNGGWADLSTFAVLP
ncbi:MAG: discoidin domain-containing protein [Candidatus Levybacteria bacterium]|nr:discoidin domain-containing protein [Candidatus Levybacteria bacterium]